MRCALLAGLKRDILYVGRLIELIRGAIPDSSFCEACSRERRHCTYLHRRRAFRERLESLCKELRVERDVHFTGWIDLDIERNRYLVPHYLWSDVCLAPSVFVRGIPDPKVLVVNAAMGCGRAVIAVTAVGSAYSMIKSGTNGFVVPGV